MTLGLKIIAACELIERLGVGSSVHVRDALGMKASNASHLIRQAIAKGLMVHNGGKAPFACKVASDWRQIVESENGAIESCPDRVMRALGEPATMRQLRERMGGASRSRVSSALAGLIEKKAVFVSGWEPAEKRGRQLSAIYSRGWGVTPERPVYVPGSIRVLSAMPGTVREIAEKTGLARNRVLDIILGMEGRWHVSGQGDAPNGGRAPAIYSRGRPPAAPRKFEACPAPESSVQFAMRTQPASVFALGNWSRA